MEVADINSQPLCPDSQYRLLRASKLGWGLMFLNLEKCNDESLGAKTSMSPQIPLIVETRDQNINFASRALGFVLHSIKMLAAQLAIRPRSTCSSFTHDNQVKTRTWLIIFKGNMSEPNYRLLANGVVKAVSIKPD
jgi:hypothetical protein